MNKDDMVKSLIDAVEPSLGKSDLSYIEIVFLEKGAPVIGGTKLFQDGFQSYPFSRINSNGDIFDRIKSGPVETKFFVNVGKEIHCIIQPIQGKQNIIGCVVFESESSFKEVHRAAYSVFSSVLQPFHEFCMSERSTSPIEKKYKQELIEMRTVQAKLFPRFEEIASMDIAAVYLPADLMTGTFVDAFFVNDDVYQIVACDMLGSDPSASIAGATIRTLFRSLATRSFTPSVLIERVSERLGRILPNIQALLQVTLFKVNVKSGAVMMSSFGDISTLFYSIKRKGVINLSETAIGKELSKKILFKDINLRLDAGDALLYYTKSVPLVASEDKKKQLGDQSIAHEFMKNQGCASRDIVHNFTETVSEFSNYSPLEHDIVFLSIKKK